MTCIERVRRAWTRWALLVGAGWSDATDRALDDAILRGWG